MVRKVSCGLVLLLAMSTLRAWGAEKAAEAVAGTSGFSLRSGDGLYQLGIRGLLHIDGRYFPADGAPDTDNEFLLRRARLSFDGKFGDRIGFRLRPEASNGVTQVIDAYIDAKIHDNLTLRAGKFKPPVGLERLQAASDLRMIERSLVTELVPSRDIGLQLSGTVSRVSWAVGIFNGVADGRTGDLGDDGKLEVAARVFAEPIARRDGGNTVFGFGIGTSSGSRAGSAGTPLFNSYRSAGQNGVFSYRGGADGTYADGERWRISPQAYWYREAFGVLGEWARVSHAVRRAAVDRSDDLVHDAWQITGEWNLTGGHTAYSGAPAAGAIQLVARAEGLYIDDATFAAGADSFADPVVAVSEARSLGLAINWFVWPGLKTSLVYRHTEFSGGALAGDRADEQLLSVRMQFSF
ncbi:MAG TPA: porin [Woeseiaceae bacterium]